VHRSNWKITRELFLLFFLMIFLGISNEDHFGLFLEMRGFSCMSASSSFYKEKF